MMDQRDEVLSSSNLSHDMSEVPQCVTLELWLNNSPNVDLTWELYNKTVNFTSLRNVEISVPVYGFVTPFLFLVTLLTNTLVVCVLSRPHMRSPSNFILCAIAISDLATLGIPVPLFVWLYSLGNHYYPVNCELAVLEFITTDFLPTICHSASIWLTLMLATQRYIYVCHPNLARTLCTMPKTMQGTVVIYIISILYNFPRVFLKQFSAHLIPWNCELVEQCVEQNWMEWAMDFLPVFYWFRVVFVNVLPCVMLIVLNTFLVIFLNKAQANRKRLFSERKSESSKQRDSNGTTMMLVAIVFVFLAVELPLAIIVLLYIIQNTWELEIIARPTLATLITFSNLCIALSYSIYFPIYCSMSRQFRDTFKELFVKAKQLSSDVRNGRRNSQRRMTLQANGCERTAFVSINDGERYQRINSTHNSGDNDANGNGQIGEKESLL